MMFKIVRGNPTPEELAAALAIVQARAAFAASSIPATPALLDEWADKKRNIPRHTPAPPGSTTWRSTYWPL